MSADAQAIQDLPQRYGCPSSESSAYGCSPRFPPDLIREWPSLERQSITIEFTDQLRIAALISTIGSLARSAADSRAAT